MHFSYVSQQFWIMKQLLLYQNVEIVYSLLSLLRVLITNYNSDHLFQSAILRLLCYCSTPFWYHLPGDSISSNRLRAQSNKTAPTLHFRCKLKAQIIVCVSDQLAIDWWFQWPLPLIYLPKWHTELAEKFYFLDHQFIRRGYVTT